MHITLTFKMANVNLVKYGEANKGWFFKAETIGAVDSPRAIGRTGRKDG
jgi:hypothetical protein